MNMTLMTTTTLVDRYMESKTCQFTCRNLDRQMIHIGTFLYICVGGIFPWNFSFAIANLKVALSLLMQKGNGKVYGSVTLL